MTIVSEIVLVAIEAFGYVGIEHKLLHAIQILKFSDIFTRYFIAPRDMTNHKKC